MSYLPEPIDTSDIELPGGLHELIELISKNTHDVWAQGKINEGWVFGKTQDMEKKTHPSLVAYEELRESDKQYDRDTTLQVIKCLLKLGARIEMGGEIEK